MGLFWLIEVILKTSKISSTLKITCLELEKSGVTNLRFFSFYFLEVLSSKINFMKMELCEMLGSISRFCSQFIFLKKINNFFPSPSFSL